MIEHPATLPVSFTKWRLIARSGRTGWLLATPPAGPLCMGRSLNMSSQSLGGLTRLMSPSIVVAEQEHRLLPS
jgi:hypothetical protein